MEAYQVGLQLSAQLQGLWLAKSLLLLTPSGSASAFQQRSKYPRGVGVFSLRKVVAAKGMFFSGIPTASGWVRQGGKVLDIYAQLFQKQNFAWRSIWCW